MTRKDLEVIKIKLGATDSALAKKLGLSLRTVQTYKTDGIPRVAALAIRALEAGIEDKDELI